MTRIRFAKYVISNLIPNLKKDIDGKHAPRVYIVEKNAFPNSVVEAPMAIPPFIGITETVFNGTEPLKNKPWKMEPRSSCYARIKRLIVFYQPFLSIWFIVRVLR